MISPRSYNELVTQPSIELRSFTVQSPGTVTRPYVHICKDFLLKIYKMKENMLKAYFWGDYVDYLFEYFVMEKCCLI